MRRILILGDSILKGIQVEPETQKYCTKNEIGFAEIGRRFGFEVQNRSHFGYTVEKGARMIEKLLGQEKPCDVLVMDFGGNDCDHNWAEIAADPAGDHRPHIPLPDFEQAYRTLLRKVKEKGILPVLTTLPPLESQYFFNWWCRDLDKKRVMEWLGDVQNIYSHQENYSRRIERIAREEQVPLLDLRGAFLEYGRIQELICADGTHPNSKGQRLIAEAFSEFAGRQLQRA